MMDHHLLAGVARQLPTAWNSRALARIGEADLKLLRMDAQPGAPETHQHAEGLLVIEGRLNLLVAGTPVSVGAGELYLVPAGVPHAVAAGSSGTLLIIEPH